MIIEKILGIAGILRFLKQKLDCTIPEIRDFLGIPYSNPPSRDLKKLYNNITFLEKCGYLEKKSIEEKEKGGAHYSLDLTLSGKAFLNQLGTSKSNLSPLERKDALEKLEYAIRLIIRRVLKDRVSKPLIIEIFSELSNSIVKEVDAFF